MKLPGIRLWNGNVYMGCCRSPTARILIPFRHAPIQWCRADLRRILHTTYAEGEYTVPSGICIFEMTGGHRRWTNILLPKELQGSPLSDQMPGVIGLMNEYLITHRG